MSAGKKTPRQRRAPKQAKLLGRYQRNWIPDWVVVKRSLQAGEFPPERILANDLRGDVPLPREVRDFLAAQIDAGRLKRPGKGKPPREHIIDRELDDSYWVHLHEFHHEEAQAQKDSGDDLGDTPWNIAVERTALEDVARNGGDPTLWEYDEKEWPKLLERVRKRIQLARKRYYGEADSEGRK
jgi:hypothetical protein